MHIKFELDGIHSTTQMEDCSITALLIFIGKILKDASESIEFLQPRQVAVLALKFHEANKESSSIANKAIVLSELNGLYQAYKNKEDTEGSND